MSRDVTLSDTAILIWNAMAARGEFTYSEISLAVPCDKKLVGKYAVRWMREGVLRRLGGEFQKGKHVVCRVAPGRAPEGIELPVLSNGQSVLGNMWTVMRRMKSFKPVDIATMAQTDEVRVKTTDAEEYCARLAEAGYLRASQARVKTRAETFFRLIRDTGPKPPACLKVSAIFDPNEGAFTHIEEPVL